MLWLRRELIRRGLSRRVMAISSRLATTIPKRAVRRTAGLRCLSRRSRCGRLRKPAQMYAPAFVFCDPWLAFDDVEGEAGKGGFFVAGLHVEAGLVHRGDDLVEGELVVAGFVHGHAAGVDGFDGAHAVALDAGDLDEAADGVAGHAEVVLRGDLGGVFDLGVGAVEGRD